MRAPLPAILLFALAAPWLLAGCPRELQPPPPGEATVCGEHAECNAGRTCGALALCVGGFCEPSPSIAVPCPEDGVPVPGPDAAGDL